MAASLRSACSTACPTTASGSSPTDTGEMSPLDRGQSLYDPVFAKDDSSVYAAGADAFIVQLPFDSKTGKLSAPARR